MDLHIHDIIRHYVGVYQHNTPNLSKYNANRYSEYYSPLIDQGPLQVFTYADRLSQGISKSHMAVKRDLENKLDWFLL